MLSAFTVLRFILDDSDPPLVANISDYGRDVEDRRMEQRNDTIERQVGTELIESSEGNHMSVAVESKDVEVSQTSAVRRATIWYFHSTSN